jgi:hypothetical protein
MPYVFRNPIHQSRLSVEKACVFTPSGHLLWRSPAWLGRSDPCAEARVLGEGWQEFIPSFDLKRVLRWLRSASVRESITFRALSPSSGAAVEVCWVKVAYGAEWIVFGDVLRSQVELPAPPCLVELSPPPLIHRRFQSSGPAVSE